MRLRAKVFVSPIMTLRFFLIQSSCLFILFFLPLFSYWCLHAFTGTERTTHLSLKTGEGVTHEEKNRMTEQKEEEEEEDREKLTHKRKSALFCFWGLFPSFISLCFILLQSPSYLPFTPLFVSLFSLWLISFFRHWFPFLLCESHRGVRKNNDSTLFAIKQLSLSPSHLMLLSASSEGSQRKRESTETHSPREKDIDSIERHGKHFSWQQKNKTHSKTWGNKIKEKDDDRKKTYEWDQEKWKLLWEEHDQCWTIDRLRLSEDRLETIVRSPVHSWQSHQIQLQRNHPR